MRISFRVKIFGAQVLTVGLLLGGALKALDRSYALKVQELSDVQARQGAANFDQAARLLRERLLHACELLADAPRVKECLEDPEREGKAGGLLLFELEYGHLEGQFLAVTDREGRPLARYHAPPGGVNLSGQKDAVQALPVEAGAVYPEAGLVRAALAAGEKGLADPEAAPDPGQITGFLVDRGRLFLVVALPMTEREHLRGAVVFGAEVTDALVRDRVQALLPDRLADGAAYGVGDRLAAASLGGSLGRAEAEAAVVGRAASLSDGGPAASDLVLHGVPYHLVLAPLAHPRGQSPIYTALFLSLQRLVDFEDQMRRLTLYAAAIAVVLCLLLSLVVSRGISAPVSDLVRGTARVANGEYSHRIVVRSRDELGDLAQAFNQMAADLATKEKVRAVLNKVVAKDVAETLLASDLGLHGRAVDATLLFADLRGFTALTRPMAPEAIVFLLNEYMTAMSQEILAAKGIVDKYVGDEIIGVFGTPKSQGRDAFAALVAAQMMRWRLDRLNQVRAGRGEPPLAMGIGVNSGRVVAGCMGSEELLSYTCIGAPVNLASRLCASAHAGQILISEATLAAAGNGVEARRLEPIRVKGFPDPVPVYEVLGVSISEPAAPAPLPAT